MNTHDLSGEGSNLSQSTGPNKTVKRLTKEEISFCPNCSKKNKQSLLKAFQIDDNEYLLICLEKNCPLTEPGIGMVPLKREDLIAVGFPGDLMLHMDVYEDDLEKITRLCTYMHIKNLLSSSTRNMFTRLEKLDFKINELKINPVIKEHLKSNTSALSEIMGVEPCRKMERALKSFVKDIPNTYLERVVSAFSKIENYKFPESLIPSIINTGLGSCDNSANVSQCDKLRILIDSFVGMVPEIEDEYELDKCTQELEMEMGIEEVLKKYNL